MIEGRLSAAWFHAHRGRQVAVASAVAGLLFGVFGHVRLETWETGRWLPFWLLAPGTLAVVTAVGVENQLDQTSPSRRRWLRCGRTVWVLFLAGCAGLAALPLAVALDDLAICAAAVLLVLATIAVSAVTVRGAVVVGLAVDAFAVVHGGQPVAARPMGAIFDRPPPWAWFGCLALIAGGVLAYVLAGPRRSAAEAPY